MNNFIKSDYTLEDLEEFRDEKGFIDLSKAGIQLTDESREKKGTEERLKNWIDFGGKKVLLRGEVVENYSVYAELIVEEIAKQIGIETAHYDLMKIKDKNGVENFGILSESIVDFGEEELITLHDLIGDEPKPEDRMEDIDFESATRYEFTIDKLKERLEIAGYSEQDINKIILDYNKRLLFGLSVLETDKHSENIAFLKRTNGDGKIRLSPNYDSEFSLLLERDKEMIKYYVDQPFGVESEAEVQDPKIGVVIKKEDGGWDEMWKDTLEALIENDEIYDYYNDNIRRKVNMESILERVEKRINAPLPDDVRRIATRAYDARNDCIEQIMDGELIPQEDQEDLDFNTLLSSLISKGTQSGIRTGEQVDIGRAMEKDMKREKAIDDKDILSKLFPSLDD